MKIAIGCDHAAYHFKLEIEEYLREKGLEFVDFGTDSEARSDYPVYAIRACKAILNGECERGLLFCGNGVGMAITANKMRNIRAVVCSEPYSAITSRQDDNTNVLCLGARVVGIELAKMIIDLWLAAEFQGGRYQKRLDMVSELEKAERGAND